MLIYPEAIVSMLFITPMEENQAILIENLIQYNDYQGYENTFQWKPKNFVRTDVNHMLVSYNSNTRLLMLNHFNQKLNN